MKTLITVMFFISSTSLFGQAQKEIEKDSVSNKTYDNYIGVSQMLVSYNEPIKQTDLLTSVEYVRKFKKQTLVTRINRIDFIQQKDYSLETEFYQKAGKHSYLFLNASAGLNKKVFPQYNLAAEFYSLAFKRVEYSLGYRVLHFSSNNVNLVFGSLGYYYHNYYFVYRPTVQIDNNKGFLTQIFFLRRYFDDEKSYLQLDFQRGNLPYIFSGIGNIGTLKSSRFIIQAKLKLLQTWYIKPFYMFEKEEYYPDRFRDKNYFQIGLIKQF